MAAPQASDVRASAGLCVFYSAGIIGMLLIYGLLQERIMSLPYGDPPMMFKDSVFLVFCNRAVGIVFAISMALYHAEGLQNKAPLWKFLAVSVSNVYASSCQYEALKYVSFPVQMLGKSFKMMPVMLWGMIVSGKRYGFVDLAVAALVTGGVTEFCMTGPISSSAKDGGNSSYGLFLLLAFLALDGFTSTFQEKLFKEHQTSKYNQMLYINLGSCVISSGTLIASGSLKSAVGFTVAHPAFVKDAMALSGAAVASQWFIYSQVKDFGALVFAATMNVRQVVSILVSYWSYGHSMTGLQAFGLAMVFAGLFFKSYDGMKAAPKNKEDLKLLPEGKLESSEGVKPPSKV